MAKDAKVLSQEGIKLLIAKEYGVPPENVFRSQYSYVVTLEEDQKGEDNG